MKKIVFLLAFMICGTSLSAMVRAGVDMGPGPDGYYYDGGYYDGGPGYDYWYGPGWYYGNYYDDYPAYYSWRRRYWGGPYYWRYHHHHRYWQQ